MKNNTIQFIIEIKKEMAELISRPPGQWSDSYYLYSKTIRNMTSSLESLVHIHVMEEAEKDSITKPKARN